MFLFYWFIDSFEGSWSFWEVKALLLLSFTIFGAGSVPVR